MRDDVYKWTTTRPSMCGIRTLTNNLCSSQPRMSRTWSIIPSCPIFFFFFASFSNSGLTLESRIHSLNHSLLLVSPLSAPPCQWPPIRAYQKPSFFFYSKVFSFLYYLWVSLSSYHLLVPRDNHKYFLDLSEFFL